MKYVLKGQFGFGFPVITISPKEYLDRGAEVILKALEPVGKAVTKVVANLPAGSSTVPYYPRSVEEANRNRAFIKLMEKSFEEDVAPALSPSNHVVAWTQGSMNPKVGLRKIAEWGPLALLGSLGVDAIGFKYVPKVVKGTPKAAVDAAAKAGSKTAKKAVIAREIKLGIKLNTKNNRIEVTGNYFNAPDKWYRITERPEKIGIEEQGKNVTTADSPETLGTINGWRTSVLDNPIETGKGVNEGYFVKKPKKINLSLRRTHGRAHGNTSQAAKGQLWQANTAGSNIFPGGVIEGEAPLTIPYGLSRTHFVNTPWEEVPTGGRIGFHTGEMPMSNLGWFQKTNKGTYTYEPIIPEKRISYQPKSLLESSTSLAFFERKPSKISGAERAGVPKLERNFTPTRHIAYYPGYQLKGLMKGSPLEKQLSKTGTINVKLLRAHFNKASQIEKDIVNQVLEDRVWGDNINYNLFKKAVLDKLITYNRKPQTKYEDYGVNGLGYPKKILGSDATVGDIEAQYPERFLTTVRPLFRMVDTKTGRVVTNSTELQLLVEELNNEGIQYNTFTFESSRLPLGNSKHYDASTLGHSRTFTTPEEPKVLHVMESQSDWGLTKLRDNAAPYTGTTKYLNDPAAYREFIDGHKRLLAKMLENPSDYLAGAIEKQIANIERHEAILKLMLGQGGWNPLAKYLHDNYLLRQLQENLKYASEHGQTVMRYPTPETAAKIEGYTPKLQWYSPTGERLDMRNLEFDTDIGDFEYPEGSIMKSEYSPQHLTILKKYADFPKMFLKLFRGHPVEIVTDSKGNTWYLVNVPKGYLNKEWQYKKGGKTHKPFGHRSILDNGWQSTKLLKNKKNVYGK